MKSIHLVIATLVSVLGGFLFGYDNLVISGAIGYVSRFYALDAAGIGWVASCAVIGCLVGSATAGWIVDRLGAKSGLWLCAVCFAASSVGVWFFAGSLTEFTLWRMLGGLGIGAASIVAPMYIAEIAPARIRGRLVTLYQLGIVLGILSAVFVNMLIQRMGDDAWNVAVGWRWMFLAGVVPAVFFAAMIVPAVESPRWLMKMNRRDQAHDVLCRLNGPEIAAIEADQIQQSLLQEEGSLAELFTTGFRRALVIGIMLAGLSQASGIFALLSFLPEVFKAAGADTGNAFVQSVLVGVILAIFTLVATLSGGCRRTQDAHSRRDICAVCFLCGRRLAVPRPRRRLGNAGVRDEFRGRPRRRQRGRLLGDHLGDISDQGSRPRHVDRDHVAMALRLRRQPGLPAHAEAPGPQRHVLVFQRRRLGQPALRVVLGSRNQGTVAGTNRGHLDHPR